MENGKVFLAEGARVMGDVTFGEGAGVWYNAVIRGDEAPIRIGERTNVQDCCVLHADKDFPLSVGRDVTVGHGAILHGCTVGDEVLIGMGSIVLNGAVIGSGVILGAGSLVTEGHVIPEGYLAFGSPAKPVRPLTGEERRRILDSAALYAKKAMEGCGGSDAE